MAADLQTTQSPRFETGLAAHRRGDLARAEAIYRDILAHTPDHADALQMLGALALQTGRPAESSDLSRRAIALRPKATAAHANHGHALHVLGDSNGALACFDAALALHPRQPDVWSNRGNVLKALDRAEDALLSYDRALALNPALAPAHFNRGAVLRTLGRHEEAIAAFRRAIGTRRDHLDALIGLGQSLLDTHQPAAAREAFDRAAALNPGLVPALIGQAAAVWAEGRLEEALGRIIFSPFSTAA